MDRPRAIPTLFLRLQEPPRALQEASKRLSEGFRVEDAIWTQLGFHFWLRKKSRGPQKSKKSNGKSTFFVVFTFSARFGLGASFWTLSDWLLAAHFASRPFDTGVLGALEPAKSRSTLVLFGPERLQELSKRLQGAPKSTPRGLPNLKRLQDASKRPRGTDFDPFWEAAGPPEAMKRLEHNCTRTPKQTSKERAVAGTAGRHLDSRTVVLLQ